MPDPTFSEIPDWPELVTDAAQFNAGANTFYDGQATFRFELNDAVPWFAQMVADAGVIRDEVNASSVTIEGYSVAAAASATAAAVAESGANDTLTSNQAVALAVQSASGLPTAPTERKVLTSLNGLPQWLDTTQLVSYEDTFDASGTWTKRQGAYRVVVECIGAGGSGGSVKGPLTAASSRSVTAGGGGGYVFGEISPESLTETETVVVGAGGVSLEVPDGNSLNNGSNGGDSSFAGFVARGGLAGGENGNYQSFSDPVFGRSGNGGNPGFENDNILIPPGAGGGAAFGNGGSNGPAYNGGDTSVGGGGGGSITGVGGLSQRHGDGGDGASTDNTTNAVGGDGAVPGGGGGGAHSDNSGTSTVKGGDGGDGRVKIITYCLETVV